MEPSYAVLSGKRLYGVFDPAACVNPDPLSKGGVAHLMRVERWRLYAHFPLLSRCRVVLGRPILGISFLQPGKGSMANCVTDDSQLR